jgi:hypothetical protein
MMIYPLVYLIIWTIPTVIRVRHQDLCGQNCLSLLWKISYSHMFPHEPHANYSVFPDIPSNNGKICAVCNWNCWQGIFHNPSLSSDFAKLTALGMYSSSRLCRCHRLWVQRTHMEPMAWSFQRIRLEKVKMFLRIRSTFVPHDDCACFKFGSISCGKRC